MCDKAVDPCLLALNFFLIGLLRIKYLKNLMMIFDDIVLPNDDIVFVNTDCDVKFLVMIRLLIL